VVVVMVVVLVVAVLVLVVVGTVVECEDYKVSCTAEVVNADTSRVSLLMRLQKYPTKP
jgi:hypothetical protein